VNDNIGHYFQTKKGVRQGDPLSPILFNIVVDILAILIDRAKETELIRGLVPNLVDNGLSILQYADDTILFMENDLEEAKNLKLLLCAFEQLSGLKINFHKSELFYFGAAKGVQQDYMNIFGCNVGEAPFTYLEIPLHYKRISNKDWKVIEDRFERKLSTWKSKLLSYGDRLTLINSVLSNLSVYMLSFFEIPKEVLKKLNHFRSRFFWQGDGHKRKYRLTKWSIMCRPKEQGGQGIMDLETQNKCLLSKWLFKLINEEGIWQQLLRNKYLANKTITQVEKKPGDSQFWSGLMKVKNVFLRWVSFKVHNGEQVSFWNDVWLGHTSFRERFPNLYNLVRRKHDTVQQVVCSVPFNVSF